MDISESDSSHTSDEEDDQETKRYEEDVISDIHSKSNPRRAKCGTCHQFEYTEDVRSNKLSKKQRENLRHKCSSVQCHNYLSCPTKWLGKHPQALQIQKEERAQERKKRKEEEKQLKEAQAPSSKRAVQKLVKQNVKERVQQISTVTKELLDTGKFSKDATPEEFHSGLEAMMDKIAQKPHKDKCKDIRVPALYKTKNHDASDGAQTTPICVDLTLSLEIAQEEQLLTEMECATEAKRKKVVSLKRRRDDKEAILSYFKESCEAKGYV